MDVNGSHQIQAMDRNTGKLVPLDVYEQLPWGPLTLVKAWVLGTARDMHCHGILRGQELLWVAYDSGNQRAPALDSGPPILTEGA